MGGLVVIIFGLAVVLGVVGFLFITFKISDLKYRAGEQILQNTGISSSELSNKFAGTVEKKQMKKFLDENPNYTDESIKELLKQYTDQIIHRNTNENFTQAVCDKMQKDSKLDKLQEMEYRRINLVGYNNSKLTATAVYADKRDEYDFQIKCQIVNGKILVESYQSYRGAALGL
jgi:uncharacterized protein YneF (UPF0154 family)